MTTRLLSEMHQEHPRKGNPTHMHAVLQDSMLIMGDSGQRTYTLYVMYSPYYRTPRLYLSGYTPQGQPLPPHSMMDDIVGDYKDKTVTLEDFPFFGNNVKMASIHPCKHAPVMKTLLDRADAALRLRREKLKAGDKNVSEQGMEGLVEEMKGLDVKGAQEQADRDDWEEIKTGEVESSEVAIRVDQYLVVFLKVCVGSPFPPFICRWCRLTNEAVHGKCDARHRARFYYGRLSNLRSRRFRYFHIWP